MMSSDREPFTIDSIIQALIQIGDEFRGRYYTIEDISRMIGGVPVDRLQTLLNARCSSPFWAQVFIQKSVRVRLEKGSSSINYYCPYSASILVSKNPMRSAEDRAANLESRPVVCPSSRRVDILASSVFENDPIDKSVASSNLNFMEEEDAEAPALPYKRRKYLDEPTGQCFLASILFTMNLNGGHPRYDKTYDPACIVFQLSSYVNKRDEMSFLQALLSMSNDPVNERQKRIRYFGTCGGITLTRVLRTSRENTKEQRAIGFNLIVRNARRSYALVENIDGDHRDVVGVSSEGDSFKVYRPPPLKPNRSSNWLDLWTRSPFINEV